VSELTFLPWLRRGLAKGIELRDSGSGPLDASAAITAKVRINNSDATQSVALRGPGDVIGLSARTVIRTEPAAGTPDFEPNYFPFVELSAPDLPWLFTPARADPAGRLRPWLVLVVVERQPGVALTTLPSAPLPVLRIEAPASPHLELPPLDESWLWAHVQSTADLADVPDAVARARGEVVSRLLCPRRLRAHRSYLACLVPAFDAGVAAGLGRETVEAASLSPAWSLDPAVAPSIIELPVLYSWRFSTGEGDFETLCTRLRPERQADRLGLHPLDITDPGLVRPADETVTVDFEGAMTRVDAPTTAWDPSHQAQFQSDLIPLLNEGAKPRVIAVPPEDSDTVVDEPVLTPPLYGGRQADADAIPDQGWVRFVNHTPVKRAAAGLGADIVRRNQEALMAAAWDDAGELRQTLSELRRARLSAEVGRSLARRISAEDDSAVIQLTRSLHSFVAMDASTVQQQLTASEVPDGLVSGAFARASRGSTALGKRWAFAEAGADRPTPRMLDKTTQRFVSATSPEAPLAIKTTLDFAVVSLVDGAQTTDPTLLLEEKTVDTSGMTGVEIDAAVVNLNGGVLGTLRVDAAPLVRPTMVRSRPEATPSRRAVPTTTTRSLDVSAAAESVRAGLDPLASVRAGLLARIPALTEVLAPNALPDRIRVGPVFADPLSLDLIDIAAELLCPGLDALSNNRVVALETNNRFVGSLLIGANHEMSRELLWRGYPADLGATFFHRFWRYIDADQRDITDLHLWDHAVSIAANMRDTAPESTVILVRGDLIARFPNAHFYLQRASLTGNGTEAEPVDGDVREPSFSSAIARDTAFYGFEVPASEAIGDRASGDPGWFLVIEEMPSAPRFGMETPKPADFGRAPTQWDELSWAHLADSEETLSLLTHASMHDAAALQGLSLGGVEWAFNSSHMATICYQMPFRMLIHADKLL
jgi:hypothetical protein